jgi:YidC/Oxa1 family membrane protein insertase
MGEQKNLFLAIGLSVAIIVIFQILFPQQTAMTPHKKNEVEQIQPATSIDDIQTTSKEIIKTKEEVIAVDDRVIISTPSLKGSINLKGAILDDLILLNYKETLDENSKNISLFLPDGTSNPYYVELGWKTLSSNSSLVNLPNLDTDWKATSSSLEPGSPVSLLWTNNQNITFKIHFSVDENYLFNVSQEIENNSS